MLRTLILFPLVLGLTGCFSFSDLSLSNQPKADRSFYTIDTKFKFFCIGNTTECYDFTKIASARAELGEVERAYNQKVEGPNYPANLIRMIRFPPDKSYTSEPHGDDGRYFIVPKNKKTDAAWNTLEEVHDGFFTEAGPL